MRVVGRGRQSASILVLILASTLNDLVEARIEAGLVAFVTSSPVQRLPRASAVQNRTRLRKKLKKRCSGWIKNIIPKTTIIIVFRIQIFFFSVYSGGGFACLVLISQAEESIVDFID